MKWRGLYITVTAFMLLTLPIKAVSEHCREDSWNQALKFQKQAESWYNEKASKFNDFLAFHKQQEFLYQEFSTAEMSALWNSQSELYRRKILDQSQAATTVVANLHKEIDEIRQQSSIIDRANNNWKNLSTHCTQVALNINSSSSQYYINTNLALKQETERLVSKLNIMIGIYQQEIQAIEALKP
ncbi:hypothetical protein [Vibrio neptunius]|uniref:ATPase n=1 Tax=Vibrio neptunius TaxID=170651 RepID=A0ABS3A4M3_9VIBR|nr:hypothetical protein [Vibrio neptunius]MBN3494012.1 hypothetical protein [Vibrio neptunius]MBN3516509.1 hypothetical protein [Vibrio neptunius]MBN3550683.1 hypothetical protein [Vibrio neptunius]MBN3578814.1 hypothetical protein [Vibrio neptunius]MCH9872479.1 hypothetical protein [Vibrio neptunius]